MSVLEVTNASRVVRKSWRDARIGPCSFLGESGEILGIVGATGAGKSVLLKLLAGVLPPSAGDVRVAGFAACSTAGRRLIGYASDPPLAPPELTGVEWLKYLACHRAASPGDRDRLVQSAVETGNLEAVAGRRIGEYSRTMAQQLGIAAAAVAGGKMVVLDEALTGVDALLGSRLRAQVQWLAARGRVVVLSSRELSTIERLVTRVLVLVRGALVADLSLSKLVRERVAEIAVSGSAMADLDRILVRFPGAVRTGTGLAVPLVSGATVEEVLAACREERIAVSASRVRYRALEDLLVSAHGATAPGSASSNVC